jgi:hypothetical protein
MRGSRFITTTPPAAMEAAPSSARRGIVARIISGSRDLALKVTMQLFLHDIIGTIASRLPWCELKVNAQRYA